MLPPVRTLLTALVCGLLVAVGPARQAPAADTKPAANDPKAGRPNGRLIPGRQNATPGSREEQP